MKFDTDFEYDTWYDKKRDEQILRDCYGEVKEEKEDGVIQS